jgi:hypothetical protein
MARSRQWLTWAAIFLAASLSGGSCPRVLEVKPAHNPPLIGAQWRALPTGEAALRTIRAFAESLEFNTAPPFADERLADFARDTVGVGDTVRIEPVSGAYLFDSTELAQGRIVARIWSKRAYRPAGFGPWWTYWWIDGSGQGGSWRSVFISTDTLTARAMTYHHNHYDVQCADGRTCARIRTGSGAVVCYNCGTWCSSPPK